MYIVKRLEIIVFICFDTHRRSKMSDVLEDKAITTTDDNCVPKFQINRQAYKQIQFDKEFSIKEPKIKKSFLNSNFIRSLNPIRLLRIFTILNLITEYNVKKDLIADIFSGKQKC